MSQPPPARPQWEEAPASTPLVPWPALLPRLRNGSARWFEGGAVDVEALVRSLEKGRLSVRLPRRPRRRWGAGVQVIVDRSDRLVPFFDDQDLIGICLARLFPRGTVRYVLAGDLLGERLVAGPGEDGYRPPAPGTLVLVLGDLGCLASQPGPLVRRWTALGHRLATAGCHPVALTPAPRSRWLSRRLPPWTMVEWDRHRAAAATNEELQGRAERLLRLVSPAIRIEPGLLREARRLLGSAADAGTEADAWQHPWLVGRSSVAGTLDSRVAKALREALSEGDKALLGGVAAAIRRQRATLPEVWIEELLGFNPNVLPENIRNEDLPWARHALTELVATLAHQPGGLAWNRRRYGRVSPAWYQQADSAVQVAMHEMDRLAVPDETDRSEWVGPGFDPVALPGGEEHILALSQQGESLVLSRPGMSPPPGSPLATVRSANGWISVGPTFWKSGIPPSWADDWGWDEYGAWVTFSIGAVTQRMRWIPPGTFLMGSPEDEPGRFDNEGPQHPVTISQGFWLFDTPVTQALWQVVMGSHPSRFYSPDRPVEQVSWKNGQGFLVALNKRLPGLNLGLPTEAQWEYACRAGSTTACYTGSIGIIDDKAEALDPIAWYWGNSGGKTHPIGRKQPNAWGLHDMLGNVWEWCADGRITYKSGPETDPTGSLEAGAARVVRGGSWYSGARLVRSASRNWYVPDDRDDDLGFRCARIQLSQSGEAGAEPSDPTSGAGAGTVSLLRLDGGQGSARCALPRGSSLQVLTDCERLTFTRTSKPDWADAMGRDRFGLWADIAVDDVRQRLRWIPPGRFLMGSPEDEPGRYDDEGPQHEVTIGEGFWLFDTPVTQGLWQAVMGGKNPIRFQSPDRPVEQVSWTEAQDFLTKIKKHTDGRVDLVLPSEAQWEYACRAGTTTALYSGDIEILGERNAPALDPIAWYGGNSGLDFTLDNGWDSSGWKEKQYPHDKAGTHPVGLKCPNAWGLYDMLGNVWEWCTDEWHGTYEGAPTNGEAWGNPAKSGAVRVIRGGSWVGSARYVRSAFRNRYAPDGRSVSLGFRCARVQR